MPHIIMSHIIIVLIKYCVISTNNSKFHTYTITPHDAFTRPEESRHSDDT